MHNTRTVQHSDENQPTIVITQYDIEIKSDHPNREIPLTPSTGKKGNGEIGENEIIDIGPSMLTMKAVIRDEVDEKSRSLGRMNSSETHNKRPGGETIKESLIKGYTVLKIVQTSGNHEVIKSRLRHQGTTAVPGKSTIESVCTLLIGACLVLTDSQCVAVCIDCPI